MVGMSHRLPAAQHRPGGLARQRHPVTSPDGRSAQASARAGCCRCRDRAVDRRELDFGRPSFGGALAGLARLLGPCRDARPPYPLEDPACRACPGETAATTAASARIRRPRRHRRHLRRARLLQLLRPAGATDHLHRGVDGGGRSDGQRAPHEARAARAQPAALDRAVAVAALGGYRPREGQRCAKEHCRRRARRVRHAIGSRCRRQGPGPRARSHRAHRAAERRVRPSSSRSLHTSRRRARPSSSARGSPPGCSTRLPSSTKGSGPTPSDCCPRGSETEPAFKLVPASTGGETAFAKGSELDLGYVKMPATFVLAVTRDPLRAMMGVRVITGAVQAGPKGYEVLARSSTGETWRIEPTEPQRRNQ